MLDDILNFAAAMLVDDGRLSMWMPTAKEDESELEILQHPCLDLSSVCVQDFGRCKSPGIWQPLAAGFILAAVYDSESSSLQLFTIPDGPISEFSIFPASMLSRSITSVFSGLPAMCAYT